MRQFASSGFRIWNLSGEAKLVYSGFGLFALLAIGVSILFYEDMVGPGTGGVRSYYAGELAAPADHSGQAPRQGLGAGTSPGSARLADQAAGGPTIVLPKEDEAPQKLTVAITYRKLLEVTHFHLFTVPVFLLIIAHLFMLTGLSVRAKSIWIAGGWLASLLHLLAPWLIRYGSSGWRFLYPISGGAMALTLSVMTAYPMWAMWLGGPREKDAA